MRTLVLQITACRNCRISTKLLMDMFTVLRIHHNSVVIPAGQLLVNKHKAGEYQISIIILKSTRNQEIVRGTQTIHRYKYLISSGICCRSGYADINTEYLLMLPKYILTTFVARLSVRIFTLLYIKHNPLVDYYYIQLDTDE